jgi:hypothetical protein
MPHAPVGCNDSLDSRVVGAQPGKRLLKRGACGGNEDGLEASRMDCPPHHATRGIKDGELHSAVSRQCSRVAAERTGMTKLDVNRRISHRRSLGDNLLLLSNANYTVTLYDSDAGFATTLRR